jgi:hypothetical protein
MVVRQLLLVQAVRLDAGGGVHPHRGRGAPSVAAHGGSGCVSLHARRESTDDAELALNTTSREGVQVAAWRFGTGQHKRRIREATASASSPCSTHLTCCAFGAPSSTPPHQARRARREDCPSMINQLSLCRSDARSASATRSTRVAWHLCRAPSVLFVQRASLELLATLAHKICNARM